MRPFSGRPQAVARLVCTSLATFTVAAAAAAGGDCNQCCPADLSGDGQVDGADLGLFLAGWGGDSPCSDFSGDGTTDGADLGVLLASWGACAGVAACACPASNHDCFVTGGPGCTDLVCCGAVCAVDSFCCAAQWDNLCVQHAYSLCALPPCPLPCPPGAVLESEPCGAALNDGCNLAVPALEPMTCGVPICATAWAHQNNRDTDWFEVILNGVPDTRVKLSAQTALPLVVGIINAGTTPSCSFPGITLGAHIVLPPCSAGELDLGCLPPGTYWMFAGPNGFAGFPCGTVNDYTIELRCVAPCSAFVANDDCDDPLCIKLGTTAFDTTLATDSAVPLPAIPCDEGFGLFFGKDLWFEFQACIDGILEISTCNECTSFDTRLAIYDAPCHNPFYPILVGCNDDASALGFNCPSNPFASILQVPVFAGQSYLIRLGGYGSPAASGPGKIHLGYVGLPPCTLSPLPPGVTPECCQAICTIDPFCCLVTWDQLCFFDCCFCPSPCDSATHSPFVAGSPGADDLLCCDLVCAVDAFCCDVAWDDHCVTAACRTCWHLFPPDCQTPNAGSCHQPRTTPGCGDGCCCAAVCAIDPFCCIVAWDAFCVSEAQQVCPCDAACPLGALAECDGPCSPPSDCNDGCVVGTVNAQFAGALLPCAEVVTCGNVGEVGPLNNDIDYYEVVLLQDGYLSVKVAHQDQNGFAISDLAITIDGLVPCAGAVGYAGAADELCPVVLSHVPLTAGTYWVGIYALGSPTAPCPVYYTATIRAD